MFHIFEKMKNGELKMATFKNLAILCFFFLVLNHSSFQILYFVCVVEFNEHVVILLF